jgi:branched-chain amino acid transport system ATP-binding protein
MLAVEGLRAGYGKAEVLHGVSLEIAAGEVVTLLGRNGMGKTTTISAIMGLVQPRGGRVLFKGEEIQTLGPVRIARLGLGLVPEGRQIFPNLTVEENLIAMAADRRGAAQPWTAPRIYRFFPHLEERRTSYGNLLSGGEQQMLAIGRALMTNPDLLILDEATEGLAPLVREEIWSCLRELKSLGQSILIVDKHIAKLARFADRHVLIEKGEVRWQGASADLLREEAHVTALLAA